MIDQALRFGAIIIQPEFQTRGRILEIGSGARGITDFVTEEVIGVDIAFGAKPAEGLIAVKASATALPFKDQCCERVISSDMLEHLSSEQRPQAIRELLRVTKRMLLFACPCGDAAWDTDNHITELYHLLKINPPAWLREHLQQGLPQVEVIQETLRTQGYAFREIPGEGTLTHFLVSLLISMKWLNRIWAKLFYRHPERACMLANSPLQRIGKDYRRLWVVSK